MKKMIFGFLFMVFALSSNAQWYYNSFNVLNINDLSHDQLNLAFTKADQSIKTGQAMTGLGAVVFIIGAIMYSDGLGDIARSTTYSGIDEGLNKGIKGAYIAGVGGIISCIGIPILISGAMRKNDIEIALVKFGKTGSLGVGFKINF